MTIGRPRHNRDDDDPLDVQFLDDVNIDTAEQAEDPGDDDGEELRDPLDGVLAGKGERTPAAGPRLVFIDRERQTLRFTSMVDFIRTARDLAAAGVELYE